MPGEIPEQEHGLKSEALAIGKGETPSKSITKSKSYTPKVFENEYTSDEEEDTEEEDEEDVQSAPTYGVTMTRGASARIIQVEHHKTNSSAHTWMPLISETLSMSCAREVGMSSGTFAWNALIRL